MHLGETLNTTPPNKICWNINSFNTQQKKSWKPSPEVMILNGYTDTSIPAKLPSRKLNLQLKITGLGY